MFETLSVLVVIVILVAIYTMRISILFDSNTNENILILEYKKPQDKYFTNVKEIIRWKQLPKNK